MKIERIEPKKTLIPKIKETEKTRTDTKSFKDILKHEIGKNKNKKKINEKFQTILEDKTNER